MKREELEKKMLETGMKYFPEQFGKGINGSELRILKSCSTLAESIIQEKDKEIRELKAKVEQLEQNDTTLRELANFYRNQLGEYICPECGLRQNPKVESEHKF